MRLSPTSVENLTILAENEQRVEEIISKCKIDCSGEVNVDLQSFVDLTFENASREDDIYGDIGMESDSSESDTEIEEIPDEVVPDD